MNIRSPARTLICLNIERYFIKTTDLHTSFFPGFKVVSAENNPLGSFALPYTPILLECGVTSNRRTGSGVLIDVVGSTVRLDSTLFAKIPGWSPSSPAFYYVIFHQWIFKPSINAEVRVTLWLVISSIDYHLLLGTGTDPLSKQDIVDLSPLTAKIAPLLESHGTSSVILPVFDMIFSLSSGLVSTDNRTNLQLPSPPLSGGSKQVCQYHQ